MATKNKHGRVGVKAPRVRTPEQQERDRLKRDYRKGLHEGVAIGFARAAQAESDFLHGLLALRTAKAMKAAIFARLTPA